MGDKTGIEWTSATWNPLAGCSLVSPGCTNCYAMKQAARIERMNAGTDRSPHYRGTTKTVNGQDVWTGRVQMAADITQPMRWKKPRLIFVNSMSDLFHESVPFEWIDRIFAVMASCPQHTFQILTKRADRMRFYMNDTRAEAIIAQTKQKDWRDGLPINNIQWPLRNVWLGVSVEDQKRADERVHLLLDTPAAVRFLSCEPLLGPVDLCNLRDDGSGTDDALGGLMFCAGKEPIETKKIDWVIVGGESGYNARPMHPDWVRSIRDQCIASGTAFFFKQFGEYYPLETPEEKADKKLMAASMLIRFEPNGRSIFMHKVGKHEAGAILDGREWKEMPEALSQ